MSGGDYFYEGANYGFDPEQGSTSHTYASGSSGYEPGFASGIGTTTDPRTANILKEVSQKLRTGAQTLEVTQLSSDVFESIPQEHFKEVNRLRKLIGENVEISLHAPIIEPTGMTKRGWNPYEREQAERQMLDAVQKAHELDSHGNVVTTFHSSAIGLPAETSMWEKKEVEGEKKNVEVLKEAMVIDERTGEIANLPSKPSFLEGEKKFEIDKTIDKMNRDHWYKTLHHVNYGADQGVTIIEKGLKEGAGVPGKEAEESEKIILGIYKDYASGNVEKVEKKLTEFEKYRPGGEKVLREKLQILTHGDIYLRDAYSGLRDMFDQAYDALQKKNTPDAKEKLERLDNFKKELQPKLDYYKDPEHVAEFAEKLQKGVDVLRSVDAVPIYKPFKDFAIEKSAETFGNVAFKAYEQFEDKTPIISIENPPAGFTLSRAEDLKQLVEASRKQFVNNAVKSNRLTEKEAQEEAKKLIGATWDVGHINMIRKFGAGKEEIIAETKKIAPFVKHVHLSDNFGFEHTEIPMGMGNVPTKEMMKAVLQHNDKFKKIVEAGNWYQHFQTIPFAESMQHFNSPIYAMKNISYWGPQGYFSGYGMNPEVHHAMYGAGFANLPTELGGQMAGRSRVSGNPID